MEGNAILVVGVVTDAVGRGAAEFGMWHPVVHLAPWRRVGAGVESDALRVESSAQSTTALSAELARSRVGTVVQTTVRLTGEVVLGDRKAERLGDWMPAEMDAELKSAVAALARPYVLRADGLGRLTYGRNSRSFRGRTKLGGRNVSVDVHREAIVDDQVADLELVNAASRRILVVQTRWGNVLDAVVAEMYPIYLESWAGTSPITRERLVNILRPDGIEVSGDRTTIFIECGALFDDHVIEVRLDEHANVDEIGLAG